MASSGIDLLRLWGGKIPHLGQRSNFKGTTAWIYFTIITVDATRWQILRLQYTKFNFGWGSAPRPRWESLQRSPDTLAGFQGPTSKGEGWENMKGEKRTAPRGIDAPAVKPSFGYAEPTEVDWTFYFREDVVGGGHPLHVPKSDNLKRLIVNSEI